MSLLFSFQEVYLGFARFASNYFFVYQKEINNLFLFLLNCTIVKISSFVVLHFCCQCFLTYILFGKYFFFM